LIFTITFAYQDQKLNDIIRILAIFSLVFFLLTFLAGINETNIEYLPELRQR
jgi:magnesium transporter